MSASQVIAERPTDDRLRLLWRRYERARGLAERDELVFVLMPLVRHIVVRKARHLPAYCEIDDLVAAGCEALIVSIERFDPGKGATLVQFVWTRVHGAVLDELRRRDWAPRSLRRWQREAGGAEAELWSRLGRRPTDDELAVRLRCRAVDVRERREQLALAEVESLAVPIRSDTDTPVERVETIASNDRSTDPESVLVAAQARERLAAALQSLPDREREIATLLYVNEMRLRDIGELLGVSESRVCQIAGTLRRRLAAALRIDLELFDSMTA